MNLNNVISPEDAYMKVMNSKGKFFTAVFIKRDGTLRVMTARMGVTKGVNGRGMSYEPREIGLLPVFDVRKREWRMINFNTIQLLKCDGIKYVIGRK